MSTRTCTDGTCKAQEPCCQVCVTGWLATSLKQVLNTCTQYLLTQLWTVKLAPTRLQTVSESRNDSSWSWGLGRVCHPLWLDVDSGTCRAGEPQGDHQGLPGMCRILHCLYHMALLAPTPRLTSLGRCPPCTSEARLHVDLVCHQGGRTTWPHTASRVGLCRFRTVGSCRSPGLLKQVRHVTLDLKLFWGYCRSLVGTPFRTCILDTM